MNEYETLIEDCRAIITEHVFSSRWSLVEGYHLLGKRLREEDASVTSNVKQLAKDLEVSERTIWTAVQFFDHYPDINSLPDGKNISMNKVKLLLRGEKEPASIDFEEKAIKFVKKYGVENSTKYANYILEKCVNRT